MGVYGATYRSVTRYLSVWGIIPLDWLYTGLLATGVSLLLLYSPNSPFCVSPPAGHRSFAMQLWLLFRAVVILTLVGALLFLLVLYR